MKLLPSHKLAILERAEAFSLSPRDFVFKQDQQLTRLFIHFNGVKNQDFFCRIKHSSSESTCLLYYSPGKDTFNESVKVNAVFPDILVAVSDWLGYLKREYYAHKQYSDLLNPENYIEFEDIPNGNQPFSKEELKVLKNQVKLLHSHIDTLQLETKQKKELKEDIESSVRKVEDEGYTKEDFKKFLIENLFNRVISWALNPETWKALRQGLSQYLFNGQSFLP